MGRAAETKSRVNNVNYRRIGGYVPSSAQAGQERSTSLSRLLASTIRDVFSAVAIESFCFESKRPSGQRAGYRCFDSKQNFGLADVYQRFDSKRIAAQNYRRAFSEQVKDAQARSWPYCAQRKGEMLMLS